MNVSLKPKSRIQKTDVSFLQPQTDCGGLISRKWFAAFICAFGSALMLFAGLATGKPDSPLLELNIDNTVATSGFYRLQWQWQGVPPASFVQFELQESAADDFQDSVAFYRGPDLASVVSGKGDGQLFYRINALDADNRILATSNTVQVQVEHHPLSRALLFFGMGALVFFFTLIVILNGKSPEPQ